MTPDRSPGQAARRPVKPRSAVARWKRQLTWFAAVVTGLVVVVAAASAAAMWQVISEVARAQGKSVV